jgi:dTDP-4-amino-4,6-dideoxygalactose transaminase
MHAIEEIARRHGLSIIEDSAHAPGASLEGRALGAWGTIGCFSFFSNKNMAIGEGGMLVTNCDDLAEKMRLLRSHGMTSLTWNRHKGHAFTYDVVDLGYNYRIDEIRAALGLTQLRKLAANNQRRAEITYRYWQEFDGSGFGLPFRSVSSTPESDPAYHIFPILLPGALQRDAFMTALRQAGIQSSIHYPPIHKFSYYQQRYPGINLPITEKAADREVTLPLFPSMSEKDINSVVSAAHAAL